MFYTKYRPQKFSEILKPNEAVDALVSQIKSNKTAHAYLFVGSRGTGKTTTARVLAKALNCTDLAKNGDPCDKCKNCIAIREGSFMDLIEIDAASNRGIDDIRDLREKVRLAPSMGSKKVYIIDEVHMLSTDAFNAFLKTLEEPPANVIFILCTTELHKVPETVKSRCQVYKFKRASQTQLIQKLKFIVQEEKLEVSDEDLKKMASASMGGYRDAETLLQQVVEGGVSVDVFLSAGAKYRYVDFVQILFERRAGDALQFINKMYDEGIDLYVWTGELLNYIRGILFVKSGADDYFIEFGIETVEDAKNQAVSITFDWLVSALETILAGQKEIRSSFIPQLPLEIAVAKVCFGRDGENGIGNISDPIPSNSSKYPSSSDKRLAGVSKKEPEKVKQSQVADDDATVSLSQEEVKSADVPISDIQNRWSELLTKAAKINSSISALLRSSKLTNVEGKFLILEVFYSFHKERIECTRNRKVIESVLKEVLGFDMSVKCVISKEKPPKLNQGEVGILTDINIAPATIDTKSVLEMLDGGLPLIQNA